MMAPARKISDDELADYIRDTIARLERLAERLETYVEDRDAPRSQKASD